MMSEHNDSPNETPSEDIATSDASSEKKGGLLRSLMIPFLVIGGYFALQLWILPAAGVPT